MKLVILLICFFMLKAASYLCVLCVLFFSSDACQYVACQTAYEQQWNPVPEIYRISIFIGHLVASRRDAAIAITVVIAIAVVVAVVVVIAIAVAIVVVIAIAVAIAVTVVIAVVVVVAAAIHAAVDCGITASIRAAAWLGGCAV